MGQVAIVTGDNITFLHTLKKKGLTFNIPETATIISRLIALEDETEYCSEVEQPDTNIGADWPNSVVSVNLNSTVTAEILALDDIPWKKGKVKARVETQVTDGTSVLTWFGIVTIIRGTIG